MNKQTIVGRAEKVSFPKLSIFKVPAKIDTGADASSIWAHKIEKDGQNLKVVFFGPESKFYTGEVHLFLPNEYTVTRISNSFSQKEIRNKVKISIKLKNRLINGTFTLSDRSNKLYPILIGRSLIRRKFIVDVSKGKPLIKEEKARKSALKEELIKHNNKV